MTNNIQEVMISLAKIIQPSIKMILSLSNMKMKILISENCKGEGHKIQIKIVFKFLLMLKNNIKLSSMNMIMNKRTLIRICITVYEKKTVSYIPQ